MHESGRVRAPAPGIRKVHVYFVMMYEKSELLYMYLCAEQKLDPRMNVGPEMGNIFTNYGWTITLFYMYVY